MPKHFGTYLRKATGVEYRFIGFAEMLHDEHAEPTDVCIMAPSVSGFTLAGNKFKKSVEHTIYCIVDQADFDTHFKEVEA